MSVSRRRFASLLLILPLLGASGPAADPGFEHAGPAGSRTPHLAAAPDGTLLATWLEPRAGGKWALVAAARERGRWTAARTVMESERHFVNWADFPSGTAGKSGDWTVHWLEKTASRAYAYHVRTAVSRDRGATWSTPVTPHSDTSSTEHGFVSMTPRPEGGTDLVWLDGRNFEEASGRGSMRLYAGTLGPDGRGRGETLLDDRTCECCQTGMVRTEAGLVVAYRNRTEAEIRDIAVVRQVNGRWTEPVVPHPDNWEFRACPVNGPQLAALGRRVALAWFSGAGGPKVRLALSADAGATFGPAIRVDDGNPLGRVEAEFLPDGSLAVFWLEVAGDRGEWRARRFDASGRPLDRWTVAATSRARDGGFLRAAATREGLFAAWTAPGEGGGVRIARYPAAPAP